MEIYLFKYLETRGQSLSWQIKHLYFTDQKKKTYCTDNFLLPQYVINELVMSQSKTIQLESHTHQFCPFSDTLNDSNTYKPFKIGCATKSVTKKWPTVVWFRRFLQYLQVLSRGQCDCPQLYEVLVLRHVPPHQMLCTLLLVHPRINA